MGEDTPHPDPSAGGRERLGPGLWIDKGALRFRAVSSSGPGGQNVNRRATRVELRVDLADLPLGEAARERLTRIASHLLTDAGELIITCEEHRSQKRNRRGCVERLGELVRAARVRPKVRKKTRPSAGAKRRRLEEKKKRGELKRRRRPPDEGA
jgi:ribosome-associated protein